MDKIICRECFFMKTTLKTTTTTTMRRRRRRRSEKRCLRAKEEFEEEEKREEIQFSFIEQSISKQQQNKILPGLYLVATPIGNVLDISQRALKVLESADVILCEDTRRTRQLLDMLSIDRKKQMIQYHEHNFYDMRVVMGQRILQAKEMNEVYALVSDAGNPAISDPGQDLVDVVLELGGTVIPIPGASAVNVAILGSGFKCSDWRFLGFLPAKKSERVKKLKMLSLETTLMVFFVSPHKLVKSLEDIQEVFGVKRRVCVCRELTKKHEEFYRATVSECIEEFSRENRARGEITLVIEGISHELRAKSRIDEFILAHASVSVSFSSSASLTQQQQSSAKQYSLDSSSSSEEEEEEEEQILERTLKHLMFDEKQSVSEAARNSSRLLPSVKRRHAYSIAQKLFAASDIAS